MMMTSRLRIHFRRCSGNARLVLNIDNALCDEQEGVMLYNKKYPDSHAFLQFIYRTNSNVEKSKLFPL